MRSLRALLCYALRLARERRSPHMRTTYGRSVFGSRNKLLVAGRRSRAVAQELRTIGIIASLVRVLIMYMSVGSYSQGHSEKHLATCRRLCAPDSSYGNPRTGKRRRGGEERRRGREKEKGRKKKRRKKRRFPQRKKIVQRHNGAYTRCAP